MTAGIGTAVPGRRRPRSPRPIGAALAIVLAALVAAATPAGAAGETRVRSDGSVPLADLLAAGFEIKAAVMAGILVQNGRLAYICTAQDRVRPVAWSCLPLHR